MLAPGHGHFWPLGYNLNNLARGPLDEAAYQISKTCTFWFQTRRFFKVFPYKGVCKTCDPLGGAIFGPRAITNNLGRGPLDEAVKLCTKYQRHGPSGFKQEDF